MLFLKICLIVFLTSASNVWATNWCNSANMKGAWKFDETSGTMFDCTSNANNGTTTASPNATGKFGKAIDYQMFNGNTNFGSAASLDNISQLSIGAWIAPDTEGDLNDNGRCDAGVIMTKAQWGLCLKTTNKLRFFSRWDGGTTPWNTSSTVVSAWDGTFHHVAATYDRSSSSNSPVIYFDGVSVGIAANSPCCSAANSDAAEDLTIGLFNPASIDTTDFDGRIDEAFIYSGILTGSDISDIMNNGLDGTQGVVASHTNFLRGGTVIRNSTIN